MVLIIIIRRHLLDVMNIQQDLIPIGLPGYALVHMGWHWVEWEAHRTSGITYGRDSVFIDKNGLGTLEVLY
ncbi:MAG: hypothetical protein M9897_13565 [Brumimicrobium sp.]|nr:hypothetical protein [Brumimicrobium sp.]